MPKVFLTVWNIKNLKKKQRKDVCGIITKNLRNKLYREINKIDKLKSHQKQIVDQWCNTPEFKDSLTKIIDKEIKLKRIEYVRHYQNRLDWIIKNTKHRHNTSENNTIMDGIQFKDRILGREFDCTAITYGNVELNHRVEKVLCKQPKFVSTKNWCHRKRYRSREGRYKAKMETTTKVRYR